MATAMRPLDRIRQLRSILDPASTIPSRLAKRACTAACIAALVAPAATVDLRVFAGDEARLVSPAAVIHAVAESGPADQTAVMQIVGKQPSAAKRSTITGKANPNLPSLDPASAAMPSAARALHLADQPRGRTSPEPATYPSQVRPVAGGLLDGWFSGQTAKSNATAKKEHEDGRKATALPPPDPSVVDWSGVPFHQPKRTSDSNAASEAPAPLRDSQRPATGAPTATATMRRSTTASPSTRQTVKGKVVSSRPTTPGGRTGSGLLPAPDLGSITKGAETKATRATPGNSSTAAELSSIKSSRRSDRRTIDALTAEPAEPAPQEELANEMPTAPVALTERLPVPSVPRRELLTPQPAEASTPAAEAVDAATIATIPVRQENIPLLPKSPQPPAAEAKSDIPPVLAKVRPVLDKDEPTLAKDELALAKDKQEATTDALADGWESIGSGVSRVPVTKPTNTESQTANTPKSADIAANDVVANDAAAKDQAVPGLSSASEQALRERLFQQPDQPSQDGSNLRLDKSPGKVSGQITARKTDSTSKQLATSELPGVRVVTEGPSEIMIRELTQYEIRVENRGSFDATGIVVQSSLPVWAQVQGHNASLGTIKTIEQSGQPQLQWTIDKLPAGVVERLFVRVKAVKSGVFDVATDWSIMPQKHLAKITVREPKLMVTIDGPEEIIYGRSEKYRVRVMNPGDGDASNVVFTLSPDSKVPQSQTIGSIPAGKEAQFEIELTARELGELKIGGVAMGDREVKTTANKSIRVAAANVEAELTGPPLKYQNAEATYHLFVTNSGKANCESIEAELRLPAGVKYVSGIQQASLQGDRLTWKIDALQPGAVREYDILCKLDRTGEMVLAFTCSGSAAGRANVSIETQVEAIADLALTVSDPVAPAPVDSEVTYEITILNRGSKAAEAVRVVAQFGPGIEPIRVEGHAGEVVTGQALFSPIARIEPGSSLRLKVVAKADRAGDHRFRAEVRHGETSLVSEEATMFMNVPAERISRRSTSR